MKERGFEGDESRQCKRDAGLVIYMKESTAKNYLVVTWSACHQCQKEFVLNPGTAPYTPFGYDDLEWQTADLVELKRYRFRLGGSDDRSEAYQTYNSLKSSMDEDMRG
ncbi:hypothetical protein PG984_011541 [Apiospora sp. TS-2023a]